MNPLWLILGAAAGYAATYLAVRTIQEAKQPIPWVLTEQAQLEAMYQLPSAHRVYCPEHGVICVVATDAEALCEATVHEITCHEVTP